MYIIFCKWKRNLYSVIQKIYIYIYIHISNICIYIYSGWHDSIGTNVDKILGRTLKKKKKIIEKSQKLTNVIKNAWNKWFWSFFNDFRHSDEKTYFFLKFLNQKKKKIVLRKKKKHRKTKQKNYRILSYIIKVRSYFHWLFSNTTQEKKCFFWKKKVFGKFFLS